MLNNELLRHKMTMQQVLLKKLNIHKDDIQLRCSLRKFPEGHPVKCLNINKRFKIDESKCQTI